MRKRCTHCHQALPLEHFHRRQASPDGLQPACKACRSQQARHRYQDDPEFRLRALQRAMKRVASGKHQESNRKWYYGK